MDTLRRRHPASVSHGCGGSGHPIPGSEPRSRVERTPAIGVGREEQEGSDTIQPSPACRRYDARSASDSAEYRCSVNPNAGARSSCAIQRRYLQTITFSRAPSAASNRAVRSWSGSTHSGSRSQLSIHGVFCETRVPFPTLNNQINLIER